METKNVVVLVGRLVADPELRYMPSGDPVANFALAVNRSVRKDDGSFEDSLDGYFDCDYFGDSALKFAEDFHKGPDPDHRLAAPAEVQGRQRGRHPRGVQDRGPSQDDRRGAGARESRDASPAPACLGWEYG
jgi:single-stranded DNA-binding protein